MGPALTFDSIKSEIAKKGAEEVTRDFLERIKKQNGETNSFIIVFENEAIDRAKDIDRRISNRETLGTLAATPLGIKDNIWIKGHPTTASTKLFEDFVPATSAKVITRMEAEDPIIIGKNNLHALALGATSTSSLYGPVKNPRDTQRIAGGSSGGTAAATAQRLVAAGLGSDTGGSVRIPAAFCGIVGLKPTFGSVSTEGVIPLSYTLDTVGTLANNVSDAFSLLHAIGGVSAKRKPSDEESREKPIDPSFVKIGLSKEYCGELESKIAKDFFKMIESLEAIGVEMIDITLPNLEQVHRARSTIMLREGAVIYSEALSGGQLPEDVTGLLKSGASITDRSYVEALEFRTKTISQIVEIFSVVDFIAMPTVPIVAPKLEEIIGNERGPVRSKLVRNTGLFNMTGMPTISIPLGGENGLYTGFQLSANLMQDQSLKEIGLLVEETR